MGGWALPGQAPPWPRATPAPLGGRSNEDANCTPLPVAAEQMAENNRNPSSGFLRPEVQNQRSHWAKSKSGRAARPASSPFCRLLVWGPNFSLQSHSTPLLCQVSWASFSEGHRRSHVDGAQITQLDFLLSQPSAASHLQRPLPDPQ